MRVFLDASLLVIAAERPGSNSDAIYRLARAGRLDVVTDEVVLLEVRRFFRRRAGRSFGWQYTEQVRRIAEVVTADQCRRELRALGTALKPADRLHLAAWRTARCSMLVGLDEDFRGFPEYRTPREAAILVGLAPMEAVW